MSLQHNVKTVISSHLVIKLTFECCIKKKLHIALLRRIHFIRWRYSECVRPHTARGCISFKTSLKYSPTHLVSLEIRLCIIIYYHLHINVKEKFGSTIPGVPKMPRYSLIKEEVSHVGGDTKPSTHNCSTLPHLTKMTWQ